MPRAEKLVSYAAVIFLVAVFGVGLYIDATKKPLVWEAKVFEVQYKSDQLTYVYSYGNGFRVFEGAFQGKYTVEADHTYRFTYDETSVGRGKIISVSEVK